MGVVKSAQHPQKVLIELSIGFDEGLGGAVGGVDEVDVVGGAAGCVDGEDVEGVLEDVRQSVDGVLAEEDQLAGMNFAGRRVGDDDLGPAGEDVEVLVAAGVEVRGHGTIDAEDAAAGGRFVGKAEIGEHGLGGFGERPGELSDVEEAAFRRHTGSMKARGAKAP